MKSAAIGIAVLLVVLGALYLFTQEETNTPEEAPAVETPAASNFKL